MTPNPTVDELRLEHESLLEFMYLCPFGLVQMDAAGTVQLANPLAANLLLPVAKARSIENLFTVLEGVAPDLRSIVKTFEPDQGYVCENRRIYVATSATGDATVLGITIIRIERDRFMAVVTDQSREVAQEKRLKQADAWFSAMLSGVNDFGLVVLDERGRVTTWTAAAERQTGYPAPEMSGRTMSKLCLPDEAVQGRALQQIEFAKRDGWHIDEGWRRRKDGSRYWCQSLVTVMEQAAHELTGFSVVLRDVGASQRDVQRIKEQLTTDHLTGVSNRAHFHEIGAAEVQRAKRLGRPLCCLMVDVDHFKGINDAHGHAAGDHVLKELSQTLQRYLRPTDILGRLGGEEFAILLPGLDLEAAKLIAASLHSQLKLLHIEMAGAKIALTVSIGCAEIGDVSGSLDSLLAAADGALYMAKRSGRNRTAVHGAPPDPAAVTG